MTQTLERQHQRGRWGEYERDYDDEDLGLNGYPSSTESRHEKEHNPPGGGRGYGRGDYNQPDESGIGNTRVDPHDGQRYARGDYGQGYTHLRNSGQDGMSEGWTSPARQRKYVRNEVRDYADLRENEEALPPRSTGFYSPGWWLRPGPYVGKGPQGWTRSKERILQDVCERMAQHGQLDASYIQVDVNDDQVTLSGTVASRPEKRLAEELAESVWGVSDVNNQLRLSPLGNSEPRSNFDRDK